MRADGEIAPQRTVDVTAERAWRSFGTIGLVAPLAIFIVLAFIGPISMLLSRSVGETAVGAALPKTVQSLVTWNGVGTPPPNAFRALADDLAATPREGVAAAATRLNGEIAVTGVLAPHCPLSPDL